MTPDRLAEAKALARQFMETYAATPGGMYYRIGMLLGEAVREIEALRMYAAACERHARTTSDPAARGYPIPIGTMQPPATDGQ